MIRQLDDRTLIGGQLQPADMAQLKQLGVSMLINNRPDGEEDGQPNGAAIQKAAAAAGIAYRAVPISRGIGPSDVEAMSEALAAAAGGKVFAYCRSGTRAALTWAVARREQGASIEEIRKAAARAGVDLTPVAHLL
jgi:uncharacterized protein (TIGR01244 family)